jgi:hypothetical protein
MHRTRIVICLLLATGAVASLCGGAAASAAPDASVVVIDVEAQSFPSSPSTSNAYRARRADRSDSVCHQAEHPRWTAHVDRRHSLIHHECGRASDCVCQSERRMAASAGTFIALASTLL